MPFPSQSRRKDRKRSRSHSPQNDYQKNKRSWLSSSNITRPEHHRQRTPPYKKKDFKSPQQRFSGRFSPSSSRRSRSRSQSPRFQKKNFGSSQGAARYSSKDEMRHRSPHRGEKPQFGSRPEAQPRKRSPSPRGKRSHSPKIPTRDEYNSHRPSVAKQRKFSPPPSDQRKYPGESNKKKSGRFSPPPQNKRFAAAHSLSPQSLSPISPPQPAPSKRLPSPRSPSPISPPPSKKPMSSSYHKHLDKESKKAVVSKKKKSSQSSLHDRFTDLDLGPFRLHSDDNVTIAILRNPRAEPSEEVTVQKIFDPNLFKMIQSKTAGKRPIFDREEIKIWKHDENLEDDPDFEERRLVRVKTSSKKPVPSLARMSPDALRKTFGLSKREDGSSHRSPSVRLNPKPDSRYESKYQQHLTLLEDRTHLHKRQKDGKRTGSGDRSSSRGQGRGNEDKHSPGGGEEEDYDLRQALERRRSGKEEDFETRGKDRRSASRRYREEDGRSVVMDEERGRIRERSADRDASKPGRGGWDRGRRGWNNRGRGRGRGFKQPWSPRRDEREYGGSKDRGGYDDSRDHHHRDLSPPNARGRGGFRRGKTFYQFDDNQRASPPLDNFNKYADHDDRDISPKGFRERGPRGGRFAARGFRGRGFRSSRRGQAFGFRTSRGGRGRGFFQQEDSRSVEKDIRRIERSAEREWKHDLYDSVQSDEELPHSTTANT